ncbi:aminotransferase class V-fold PLP-dependent enzyme [Candidatus Woesearchaeota archaeon]|nr:aminotransferase class V-fold PLP-dependent enzyme [Candidatus Woesearchaeota archaeon]
MNEKIRQDFPLYKEVPGIIYVDSACVALKPIQVIEAMNEYYYKFPACAARSNHKLGDLATNKVADSRKTLAKFINAKEQEIIFTRNTTESINLISHTLKLDGTVLTTDKEHNSNLIPWLKLAKEGKITHKAIETKEGKFSMESYEKLLQEGNVQLVAINHISNMDGIENPVKEITKLAHDNNALVMVDGAQSAPHIEVNVKKLDIDFYACSGHKMLGPSGTGMLYGKKELLEKLDTFILGGETVKESWIDKYELEDLPFRFEGGLQNYAGIYGMAAAAKYLQKIGLSKVEEHSKNITRKLREMLADFNVDILNPEGTGITSIIPKKMKIHELNLLLSNNNIMTRSGTHCVHSWFNKHDLPGSVRFSTYLYNTEEEVEKIAEIFDKQLKELL